MLKLMVPALRLLRAKHKNGESYYWILYYSFSFPAADAECGRNHGENCAPTFGIISYRTYCPPSKRRPLTPSVQSFEGYTSADSFKILEQFYPDKEIGM